MNKHDMTPTAATAEIGDRAPALVAVDKAEETALKALEDLGAAIGGLLLSKALEGGDEELRHLTRSRIESEIRGRVSILTEKAVGASLASSQLQYLYDDAKRKNALKSRTSKMNARRAQDDMVDWPRFLKALDKTLKDNQGLPPRKRLTQENIIKTAIGRHNETAKSQITISWDGVKKKWQRRYPKRTRKAR